MEDISVLIDNTLNPLVWPATICQVDWGPEVAGVADQLPMRAPQVGWSQDDLIVMASSSTCVCSCVISLIEWS